MKLPDIPGPKTTLPLTLVALKNCCGTRFVAPSIMLVPSGGTIFVGTPFGPSGPAVIVLGSTDTFTGSIGIGCAHGVLGGLGGPSTP